MPHAEGATAWSGGGGGLGALPHKKKKSECQNKVFPSIWDQNPRSYIVSGKNSFNEKLYANLWK